MIADSNYGAYSAHVEMGLIVNGMTVGITHMGRDYIIVDSAIDVPPGKASIILKVDDSESRWEVSLPKGISSTSKRVMLGLAE